MRKHTTMVFAPPLAPPGPPRPLGAPRPPLGAPRPPPRPPPLLSPFPHYPLVSHLCFCIEGAYANMFQSQPTQTRSHCFRGRVIELWSVVLTSSASSRKASTSPAISAASSAESASSSTVSAASASGCESHSLGLCVRIGGVEVFGGCRRWTPNFSK